MKRIPAPLLAAAVIAACSDAPTTLTSRMHDVPTPLLSTAPVNSPIPGHYIVVFKNNVLNVVSMASSIATSHGKAADHVYTSALKGVALALTDAEADSMRADPSVAYVEQDQTMTVQTTQAGAPWGLDRTDQHLLPLSGSYVYNGDGTGVTAYIIDTGINYTHVEFGGRAVKGIDIVTPGGTAEDCHGHGSAVASVVGGSTFGVAKNVRLVAVRITNCAAGLTTSDALAGVDWVTAHRTLPAVANLSIAVGFSTALNQGVENSIASGVVYSIAAGNNYKDACLYSPGSAPDVITVGSSNKIDQFSNFSNFGPCVDIAAPGEAISVAWYGSTTITKVVGGTSVAAPHIAGIAALYFQAHPTATAAQARAAIIANGTTGRLTSLPAGTPNLLAYSGFIAASAPAPVASFTATCPLLTCGFDASSSTALSNATYSWTYGDAASGTGTTSTHAYAAAGTYSVTLTVADSNGANSKTISVTPRVAANQAPVANFTDTCPTMSCTFDASTSSDDLGIVSYTWTWGDGRVESHVGSTATSAYAAQAMYSVTLMVTDGSGQTSSVTKAVSVPNPGNQSPTATASSPSINATYVQGASVPFAGTGSDPEDGTLSGSSLTWVSSMDGPIGTGVSFSKSNLSIGSHVITLTATDAGGAQGTATRTITVTAPLNQAPVANFTWTCTGPLHKCTVSGSSSTDDVGVTSYTWNWGNGKTETHAGSTSGNTWAVTGPFNVTLTVKDASGLTNTIVHTVAVP
ncbi:MAG: PKD domain-containing protein [bacterium]